MNQQHATAKAGATVIQAGRDVVTGNIFLGRFSRLRDAWLSPAPVFDEVDLDRFSGREWLRDQVDQFIADHDRGYVVIQAAAGLGKTAFAAWFARSRDLPCHFTRRRKGRVAAVALRSLAAQLIARFQLDEHFAPAGMLPETAGEPGWFEQVLWAAADAARGAGQQVVIVVDGLDEAEHVDGDLPLGLPAVLPACVFFVATCRTGTPLPQLRQPWTALRIRAEDARNIDDLRGYLDATDALTPDASSDMSALLIARCGGVWVYLKYVLDEFRRGMRDAESVDVLPADLAGYYFESLVLPADEPHWRAIRLPLLATLAVAAEPLPSTVLARLAHVSDAGRVHALCLGPLRPFLTASGDPPAERRYGVYHVSLREFLAGVTAQPVLDGVQVRSEELVAAARDAHNRVADDYLRLFGDLANELDLLGARPELATTDGGYPLRQLAYHLEQAGRIADLHHLLACEHHVGERVGNVWFDAHSHAGSLGDYVADLRRARRLAEHDSNVLLDRGRAATTLGLEIRYAVMMASVASLTTNVPVELLVRLIRSGMWEPERALGHARRRPDPRQRATALGKLLPALTQENQQTVVAECQVAIEEIGDEDNRAWILAGLLPQLPDRDRPLRAKEVLAAALHGEYVEDRPWLLWWIVDHLPSDLVFGTWQHIVREAAAIKDKEECVEFVREIAEKVPERLLPSVLVLARDIGDEHSQASIVTSLTQRLTGPLLTEAFEIARAIPVDHLRGYVLGDLASTQTQPQQTEVLDEALLAARAEADLADRACVLITIVRHLSPTAARELLAEATILATNLPDPHQQAVHLTTLGLNSPEDLQAHLVAAALSAARRVENESARMRLLCSIAELPIRQDQQQELLAEALALVADIDSEYERAQALEHLASRLPDRLMPGALGVAGRISEAFYRLWSIGVLAPYLPDDQLGDALSLTQIVTDDYGRAQILGELAVRLTEPRRSAVLAAAVEAARSCPDGYSRANALVELALRHGNRDRARLLDEGLAAARSETGDNRAEALASVAMHLPTLDRERVSGEALDAARLIDDPEFRVEAMRGIFAGLSGNATSAVADEAFELVRSIETDYVRLSTMAMLATHFTGDQRDKIVNDVLKAALAWSGDARLPMSGIQHLARYLRFMPKSLRNQLLATVSEATLTFDEAHRLDVIFRNAKILRRLPRGLVARLLASVRGTPLNYNYSPALGPLAVHLPAPLAEQVIAEALRPTRRTRLARRGILNQTARLTEGRALSRADLDLARRCLDTTGLEDCLSVLAAGVPLLVAAAGPPFVDDCLATVLTTHRWWQTQT